MSDLKEVMLINGEQILHKLQGDAYNQDPNPLMKVFGKIKGVFCKIFGISQKMYLVQTSHRFLLVDKGMIFWKFPRDTRTIALSPAAIDYVGYTQARRWVVFKSLFFNIGLRNGEGYEIKFDGTLPELVNVSNSINEGLFKEKATLAVAA
ncbi:hypothetical protein [Halobacteriovorax marinus]|uniref:hypothetical protein n=1 Tax=Halobacteriovorax marinus TaxID=97084 RepID=UPI003A8DACE8